MSQLVVFQSLWAMQNHQGRLEQNLDVLLARIAATGFDGVTDHFWDPASVDRLARASAAHGLQIEGQMFPRSVDDLARALEVISIWGCHQVTLQADLRLSDMGQAVKLVAGWLELAAQVPFPVLLETHRYRLTNDLPFTLQLLSELPELRLLADLSHFVVGRELPLPPAPDDEAQISAILANSWGFHGRVSNGEQIQVPLSFSQHRPWVEQFSKWWLEGMVDWLARPRRPSSLGFTCELGPPPYAITDAKGKDISDRWKESVELQKLARRLWLKANRNGSFEQKI